MVNTLYLPELREMLAEENAAELREFSIALHPARTAEFMEGLNAAETWAVLQYAEPAVRQSIFPYIGRDKQIDILESHDRAEIADLVAGLPPDDRVDLLQDVREEIVRELLPLLPTEERRDILRLQAYPEGTAGAMMTTSVVRLGEDLSVRDAMTALSRQAEEVETIYYLYIVDATDHLRGVVSARKLVAAIGKPDLRLRELMETDVTSVTTLDDQEEVARKVAHYDLHAIPVVDSERRFVGIITHDDVIDVLREEATEDAQRIAAVAPLEESYLRTSLITLSRKRGVWLSVLFFGALFTAMALDRYDAALAQTSWLVLFIPLVISSGGNSGSQSATLIITAMATGDVTLGDWYRVVRRELVMGLLLGGFLALFGFAASFLFGPRHEPAHLLILPITLVLVVLTGTLCGASLPLVFRRLGLDPAIMSNPFVAGIVDILGIIIYMNVALNVFAWTS
ncbi:MAG: magnesium transporter [Planctomycetes bacterium]|nr:magnesium transporter [Planctomycetota bacterium]